ncbi:MmgE/PrpD family protein [Chloroflexota bacterium]
MAVENKVDNESITKILAKFIHNLNYDDLPEGVTELAKTRILDALSSAYAGRDLPHSRTAKEIAKRSHGDSTIFGCEAKTAPLDAVLANSVLVHSIFQEDTAFMGHPGTMVIPVALAVGEQERASGKETLVAIVVGYELMGRISRSACPLAMAAFRPGPIMGTFGAAATAGRLMKLNVDKLTHALGYAASLAPAPPQEGFWSGTMEPMFEAGVCAQIGVLSAILANGGATTNPQVLEGRHGFLRCWAGTTEKAPLITEGLGKTFAISETVVKPYPACAMNQLPIQASLPLAKLDLRAKDIARVVEKTGLGGTSYAGSDFAGPFTNQVQAQMSLHFCAAATILGRQVDSFSFYTEHYDDPEVAELAGKVELVCEEGRTKPRLEVYTHDGRAFTAEEEKVDRGPLTPSRENMENKFTAMASSFLGEERVHQVIDLVMNLDKMGNICELTAKL